MSFTLEEFTLENCGERAPSIFILGARNTGKSTLIKKLIGNSTSVVFGCGVWEQIDPSVYTDIKQFFDLVQQIKQRSSAAARQKVELPQLSLVIDDMIHEPDGIMSEEPVTHPLERWENQPVVQDVLYNCRHWNTSFILASQYMLIQKPSNRQQLEYIFIFAGGVHHSKERLDSAYRYYLKGRGVISQEVFENCMGILKNHQALVIDYKNNKVYYYRH